MQKRKKVILIIVGILAAIFLYTHLAGFWNSHRSKQPVVTVSVITVTQKNITVPLQLIATVQPYSTVTVKSLVDGELLQVGFKEGDFIKKGQLLFQIDPRPFQAQLDQAKANLAKDQANLENAHSQIKRNEELAKKGYVAAQDFDQLRTNEKTFAATAQADQAAVNNAELQLSYATIAAPIDGRTGNLLVYPGNIIKTGNNTNLVTITQINPIYVVFSVPQQYLSSILEQQAKTPIIIRATFGNETEEGRLTFIDNTVDTTTGTIQLKATFQNSKQHLWPGQFVTVVLPAANIPNALLVPSRAIQSGQDGSYVYLALEDNTARMQTVKTGPMVDDKTVILQGLQVGDKVITDGLLRLTEGAPIKIESSTP